MDKEDSTEQIKETKEENNNEINPVNNNKEDKGNSLQSTDNNNEKPKKRKGDQYLVQRLDLDKIDFKNLTEEKKSELKPQLEEECVNVCNCYLEELAISHKWTSFDHIRMANDADLDDDLFDENNDKLKSKLRAIAFMFSGCVLSYYFQQSWIFFLFQAAALAPYFYDTLTNKEQYDSYIVPNKKAYLSSSNISFGFKKVGKGRLWEQDPSLYPKAAELYEYFKETLLLIRTLRPSKNAKKNI